jgi:hypothetical protein
MHCHCLAEVVGFCWGFVLGMRKGLSWLRGECMVCKRGAIRRNGYLEHMRAFDVHGYMRDDMDVHLYALLSSNQRVQSWLFLGIQYWYRLTARNHCCSNLYIRAAFLALLHS